MTFLYRIPVQNSYTQNSSTRHFRRWNCCRYLLTYLLSGDDKVVYTYDESELVEAVKNVEQWTLAAVDEIGRLKQWRLGHTERFGGSHETLDVAQSHEAGRRFRSVEDRRHSSSLQQAIHQPAGIKHSAITRVTRSHISQLVRSDFAYTDTCNADCNFTHIRERTFHNQWQYSEYCLHLILFWGSEYTTRYECARETCAQKSTDTCQGRNTQSVIENNCKVKADALHRRVVYQRLSRRTCYLDRKSDVGDAWMRYRIQCISSCLSISIEDGVDDTQQQQQPLITWQLLLDGVRTSSCARQFSLSILSIIPQRINGDDNIVSC